MQSDNINLSCPVEIKEAKKILLAHGSGGRMSNDLIDKLFLPIFNNEQLNEKYDSAIISIEGIRFAFTTDSFVVKPVFFPGGNIGDLAINGTVNDLAVCGAKPLFISVGLIIEEGFEISQLELIVQSMKRASNDAGVQIVTGDTKVVEKGSCDNIFINTSGIGIIHKGINLSPKNCKPGDVIIINGGIAEHGIAIMASREGLEFETTIKSDTTALNKLTEEVLSKSKKISMMRDPTRGGIASSLNEIATASKIGIEIEETSIPIKEEVKGACEILGFDALQVANEGKLLLFIDESDAELILNTMKNNRLGKDSAIIGKVVKDHPGIVTIKTSIGTSRIVEMLSGEQLPRIC